MVYLYNVSDRIEEFKLHTDGCLASTKRWQPDDDDKVHIAGALAYNLAETSYEHMPDVKLSVSSPDSLSDLLPYASALLPYGFRNNSTSAPILDFLNHYHAILTGDRPGWRLYGVEVMDDCIDLFYAYPQFDKCAVIRLEKCPLYLHFDVYPEDEPEENSDDCRENCPTFGRRFWNRSEDEFRTQTRRPAPKPKLEPTHVVVFYNGSHMEVMTGDGVDSRYDKPIIDGMRVGRRALRISRDPFDGEMVAYRYYHQTDLTDELLAKIMTEDDGYQRL